MDSTAQASVEVPSGPATNEQILAELVAMDAPAPAPDVEVPAAPVEAAPVDADSDPDDADDDADSDDDGAPVASDPKSARGLDQVRRAEQRMRAEGAKDRADIERLRAEHAEDVKATRDFAELRKRARYDVPGALRALGVTDDMFEDATMQIYSETEKGKVDPRYRARVEQTTRERRLSDRQDESDRRMDARDKADADVVAKGALERSTNEYLDGITKSVAHKSAPLASYSLEVDAVETRKEIAEVAGALWSRTGERPKSSDVLKAYEAMLGARTDRAMKIAAKRDGAGKPAAAVAPAKVAASAAPTVPGSRFTDAEILAEIQSGKFR